MLLKSVVIKKDNLTTVNESCTLEEALSILEDSGYRCVPILDESEKFSEEIFIKCIFTAIKQTVAI